MRKIDRLLFDSEARIVSLEKHGDSPELAEELVRLAALCGKSGMWKAEHRHAARAEQMLIRLLKQNLPPDKIRALENVRGDACFRMSLSKSYTGDHAEALRLLRQAEQFLKNAPAKLRMAVTLHSAMCLYQAENHEEAVYKLDEIILELEHSYAGISRERKLAKLYWLKSLPLIALKDYRAADTTLKKSFLLYNKLGERRHFCYYSLGQIREGQGRPSASVAAYRQAVDLLEAERSDASIEEIKIAQFKWRYKTYRDLVCVLANTGRWQDALYYSDLARSRATLDFLEEGEITRGRVVAYGNARIHSPKEILPHVPDDTLVLAYFNTGEETFGFSVSRNTIIGKNLGRINLDFYRLNMEHRDADICEDQRHLFEKLVRPLLPQDANQSRLVVIPHGALHGILYAKLLDENGVSLAGRFPGGIARALGLNFFLRRPDFRELKFQNAAVFGDGTGTLQSADAEARAIASQFGGMLFAGKRSTRKSFLDALQKFQVVHFAGHGQFHRARPMQSCLFFVDGPLTAQTIMSVTGGRESACNLLSISSCSSGMTRRECGDEIFGLIRAFQMARVKRLAVNLTTVADEASPEFFSGFYSLLKSGVMPDAAISNLHARDTEKNLHPFDTPTVVLY